METWVIVVIWVAFSIIGAIIKAVNNPKSKNTKEEAPAIRNLKEALDAYQNKQTSSYREKKHEQKEETNYYTTYNQTYFEEPVVKEDIEEEIKEEPKPTPIKNTTTVPKTRKEKIRINIKEARKAFIYSAILERKNPLSLKK